MTLNFVDLLLSFPFPIVETHVVEAVTHFH